MCCWQAASSGYCLNVILVAITFPLLWTVKVYCWGKDLLSNFVVERSIGHPTINFLCLHKLLHRRFSEIHFDKKHTFITEINVYQQVISISSNPCNCKGPSPQPMEATAPPISKGLYHYRPVEKRFPLHSCLIYFSLWKWLINVRKAHFLIPLVCRGVWEEIQQGVITPYTPALKLQSSSLWSYCKSFRLKGGNSAKYASFP